MFLISCADRSKSNIGAIRDRACDHAGSVFPITDDLAN